MNTHLFRCRPIMGLIFLMGIFFMSVPIRAQIAVTGNQTATALAQALIGNGVTISNPTLNCSANANGLFNVTTSNLGLPGGIVLTSGQAQTNGGIQGANGPALGPSTSNGTPGDPDLTALVGGQTFDRCVLEFDFVPLGDSIQFQYVFGSTEYPSFTCSNFNDVFGFFISGPGITGPYSNNSKNIALVPGSTTCPVGVSTIYCPNQPGCCNTANTNCFNLTPGCAMFNAVNNTCAYFVCNAGGASVNYQGFTVPLTASAVVVPCSTYHLKLAIADKGDQILDSGVFLKQGSLTSNSITFQSQSILNNPYPYIVEGCASGFIKVTRSAATPFAQVINYQVGGVATYPADYNISSIPPGSPFGSVTIPANDTIAFIAISALTDGLVEGLEEIKIYQLAPCTNNIVDSASIMINDSFVVYIMTPDTAVCKEDSVNIMTFGDTSLTYTWTPATNINNPALQNPSVSPNVNTTYFVCGVLPGAGCQPTCDSINIIINDPPVVKVSNDTIICRDMVIQYNPVIVPNQAYTYTWSGSAAGFLNNTSIPNPIGTYNTVGNYSLILNVEPQAVGCAGADTVNILVLPNDIILHNGDTAICAGAPVNINVTGHPLFNYNWVPSLYLNNPNIEDPISVPDSNITYTVTASFPGCIDMSKSFSIDVQPNPIVYAGPDREMCDYDTIQMHGTVMPAWYNQYTYLWAPPTGLNSTSITDPIFSGSISVLFDFIVTTPAGCSDTDQVFINVKSSDFAAVSPGVKSICPGDTVFYVAQGGQSYYWTPGLYLSDTLSATPYSVAETPIQYEVRAFLNGCIDTERVVIDVVSAAVLDAGNDVTLYPGETHEMDPLGNCSFFLWTPNYHLTRTDIPNPIASPPVTTRYFVTGTTEYGCKINDSITIRISDETILDLPNAFSPGSGTSINDDLKIIKRGEATLNYFRIFNRWGEKVFETTNIDQGWNGRYKGVPQPMGVFVYVLDAKTSTGKRIYKQGNVSLIR
jgi:gliding motility-associated-like protein